MTWKGERQRHQMSAKGVLTAKGTEYEDSGGSHYESDEVKFERRHSLMHEKVMDLFEDGKIQDAIKLNIIIIKEAESMYGPFSDDDGDNIVVDEIPYNEWIVDLANEYKWKRGNKLGRAPKGNMPILPWVKPTINTFDGKAYYIGTEVENKYGKWDDHWYSGAGEFVTHHGKLHHVYVTNKWKAGLETTGNDKFKKISDLLQKEKIKDKYISPNFVKDFAHNRGIDLTSEQVVNISNKYKGD